MLIIRFGAGFGVASCSTKIMQASARQHYRKITTVIMFTDICTLDFQFNYNTTGEK
jgi:hypothetical protein